MECKKYFVYGLIDPRTDTPFYIGKGTINPKRLGSKFRRVDDHIKGYDTNNTFKVNVMSKIEKVGCIVEHKIYEIFDNEQDSYDYEISLILKFGRRNNNTGILTNLTDGGDGMCGYVMSDETKLKLSNNAKAYNSKYGNPFKGKKHKEETKKIMSEIQKRLAPSREILKPGRVVSDETKQKLRDINLGKKIPKEICYKFAHHGSDNCQAKKFIFKSPNGAVFHVYGGFKKFIYENSLSLKTCKDSIDSGIIPPPKDPNHNRLTIERINTTGWEITKVPNDNIEN